MTDEASFDVQPFTIIPETGAIMLNGLRRDRQSGRYSKVTFKYKTVKAHRLAWRLYHGEWPAFLVDHKDRNSHNNSITNLRQATYSQNCCNQRLRRDNTSGERGVVFVKSRGKGRWKVSIQIGPLKVWANASHFISAVVAARLIRRVLHGEFAADLDKSAPTIQEAERKPAPLCQSELQFA
jgi:hypothetical protein